jgi:hypothetical protein
MEKLDPTLFVWGGSHSTGSDVFRKAKMHVVGIGTVFLY